MEDREEIRHYAEELKRGRISRRRFMELMTMAGVGVAAAACTAPPPAAAPAAATSAPAAAAPTSMPAAAAPTAAAAAGGGKKIVADYMASGTYDQAAKDLAPAWQSQTGNTVDFATFPWEVLNQNNITDLSTQTGQYDVISGEWWIASVFEHMLPLDDYTKRDNVGPDYIEGLWQPGPSQFYGGKRVGVPYSADAYAILYNKDLYDQAGIKPEWKTWEDFVAVMAQLKSKLPAGIAPHAFAFGAPEQPGSVFLGAYDGYLVGSDNTYKVDKPKAVAALETALKLVDYGPANVRSLSIDEANAVFMQGKSATLIGWPSFLRAAADDKTKSQVVGKWQLSPFPGPGFPLLSCWNLFVSKYSKNPEVAWSWIKAYANAKNGTAFMDKYGIGSPFKATYEDQTLLQKHAHDFPAQKINLGRAKAVPYTYEAYEALFRNFGDMVAGSATPDQVVDRWHQAWATMKVPQALLESAEKQGFKQTS